MLQLRKVALMSTATPAESRPIKQYQYDLHETRGIPQHTLQNPEMKA